VSDTDSFIDEVSEEIRREKLFKTFRKYGWIGVALVVLVVGGTGYREYSRAAEKTASETFGSSVLEALQENDPSARVAQLDTITVPNASGGTMIAMLQAAELASDNDGAGAAAKLEAAAVSGDLDQMYRDILNFKRLTVDESGIDAGERRMGFEQLATPGNPLRLLAEEQLALLDLTAGDSAAAVNRLSMILEDAELTQGLRQRAGQLMIALGQDPNGQ
jgi:hypothetical protein